MAEAPTARTTLNDGQRALLDERVFATVTTLLSDGSPHTTVVWVDRDGEDVLFNTSIGKLKERNLQRDPRVSIALFDPVKPFRGIVVRGRAEITEEGGLAHINRLSQKYDGRDYQHLRPGERRVTVRVRADRVSATG